MKLGIFTSFGNVHHHYQTVCEKLKIEYELIDISSHNWLELIKKSNCDGYLCRPPSTYQERKAMYDEKLYVINKLMNKKIYPSYEELFIYENKKMMSYWLELNGFPHAKTHVFYNKKEYREFIKNCEYPLVFKTNIGASSKGVQIIKNKQKAKLIGKKSFGFFGAKLSLGYTPQLTGKIFKTPAFGTSQKHFVILQEFAEIKWEWRMIKIGESYFGHQKLLNAGFASGSGKVGWVDPPKELLFMVKDICEKGNFNSMAIDIFETKDGRFLVNELQSIFGSIDESQMYIDGVPGRYVYENDNFVFEQGKFNVNGSYMLRVKHFIEIIKEERS